MQDKIPQTLTEYIERNHADDYNWTALSEVTRLALAAYEIVDAFSHNLQDAIEMAETSKGQEIAGYTAKGWEAPTTALARNWAVSPILLAAAVENRARQALARTDEMAPDVTQCKYLRDVLSRAKVLQDKED